jgi:hypothetical protein
LLGSLDPDNEKVIVFEGAFKFKYEKNNVLPTAVRSQHISMVSRLGGCPYDK